MNIKRCLFFYTHCINNKYSEQVLVVAHSRLALTAVLFFEVNYISIQTFHHAEIYIRFTYDLEI